MLSRRSPGPNDAILSTGIGNNASPPPISAPVPRRATNDTILSSDTDDSRRYSTPPLCSPSSALNQLSSLNGIPDTQDGPSSSGGNAQTPHHDHSRTTLPTSSRSGPNPSPNNSPHFSPRPIAASPDQIRTPPRGATPIRSSIRSTHSPARNAPQDLFLTHDLDTNSVQRINISINVTHSTPSSPIPPAFGSQLPPRQHSNEAADVAGCGVDDRDGRATPEQRMFQSRFPPPGNLHSGTPPVRHGSPSEPGYGDSQYLTPLRSVFARSAGRVSPAQFQNHPRGTSGATSYQNQAGMISPMNEGHPISHPRENRSADQQWSSGSRTPTNRQASRSPPVSSPLIAGLRSPSVNAPQIHTSPNFPLDPGSMMLPTNQGHPASLPQVNWNADQQRSSGSRTHVSRQASRSPTVSSSVTPGFRSPSVNAPQSHNSTNFPLDPGGSSHTVPTPDRSARRQTINDQSPLNASFGHPVGGQSDGRPRSSQSWCSQHTTSHGPARTNGNGNDPNIDSVIDNLLRVPPTQRVWCTQRGVLTLTNGP